MKVLKKGRSQKSPWAKELRCTGEGNQHLGCGALLLVEFTDLFVTGKTYMDGSHQGYITFRCPDCGAWTDVQNYHGPTVTKGKPIPDPASS